jgi:hypothetical protein
VVGRLRGVTAKLHLKAVCRGRSDQFTYIENVVFGQILTAAGEHHRRVGGPGIRTHLRSTDLLVGADDESDRPGRRDLAEHHLHLGLDLGIVDGPLIHMPHDRAGVTRL